MLAYSEHSKRRGAPYSRTFSFIAIGAVLALLSLIASADDGLTARTAPVSPALAVLSDIPSHNGMYRASMIPSADPIVRDRLLAVTVEIRTATGAPVEGALLTLESWMPDDEGVRAAGPRAVSELGGGRYLVEGLRLHTAGWWNLRLQISAAKMTDSLAFNLVLP